MLGKRSYRERGHDIVRKVAGGTPPERHVPSWQSTPPSPEAECRSASLRDDASLAQRDFLNFSRGGDRRQRLAFFPPIFFFLLLCFWRSSHRPRAHWDLREFLQNKGFLHKTKKTGRVLASDEGSPALSEECGRRRAGTALEGRVSERERPGRRKARED